MIVKIGRYWFNPKEIAFIGPGFWADTFNACTEIRLSGNQKPILTDGDPEEAARIVCKALKPEDK